MMQKDLYIKECVQCKAKFMVDLDLFKKYPSHGLYCSEECTIQKENKDE